MVGDRKVLSFVMYRVQMLDKMVSDPPLGLTDVEEASSGATDAVDQVGGCRSVENARDAVEGIFDHQKGDVTVLEIGGHLGCAGVECLILGADMVELEELGAGDHILSG
eukprot:g16718.t1